jgi:hypothetical protein
VRANSVRLVAVVAALALSLLWATAAFAVTDEPATDEEVATQAADTDSNADEAVETVTANEQSLRGDGRSQEQEVSVEQTGRRDDDDARVRKAATDRDCSSFNSQEQAQKHFNNQGGSAENNVENLDADGDGVACESLSAGSAPTGGPDTGGGGTAPPPNGGSSAGPLPFVLAGAAFGLLVALLGPSLRRRVTT